MPKTWPRLTLARGALPLHGHTCREFPTPPFHGPLCFSTRGRNSSVRDAPSRNSTRRHTTSDRASSLAHPALTLGGASFPACPMSLPDAAPPLWCGALLPGYPSVSSMRPSFSTWLSSVVLAPPPDRTGDSSSASLHGLPSFYLSSSTWSP